MNHTNFERTVSTRKPVDEAERTKGRKLNKPKRFDTKRNWKEEE